jgi:hypothetical protein
MGSLSDDNLTNLLEDKDIRSAIESEQLNSEIQQRVFISSCHHGFYNHF